MTLGRGRRRNKLDYNVAYKNDVTPIHSVVTGHVQTQARMVASRRSLLGTALGTPSMQCCSAVQGLTS